MLRDREARLHESQVLAEDTQDASRTQGGQEGEEWL